MLVSDFHFELPGDLIAQQPAPERDGSRLLVLHRQSGTRDFRNFPSIREYLSPGDLLVFNDARVIPARLRGHKVEGSGAVEILLLSEASPNRWWTLLRPGKRVRPGTQLAFGPPTAPLGAQVLEKNVEGHCLLHFNDNVLKFADLHGEIPLPPYIERANGPTAPADRERYQTVYAANPGSVAAPTAGLHFTRELIQGLHQAGIETATLTLHVGAGTFLPVKVDRVEEHRMHEERFTLPGPTAIAINRAKASGRRVIAIGTTTARVLESVARGESSGYWGEDPAAPCTALPHSDSTRPFSPLPAVEAGRTRIFLRPPCHFRVLDGLLTNFHLPQSTLLMLVSAFAAPGEPELGRQRILETYKAAVEARFRFFSYGDAMLML